MTNLQATGAPMEPEPPQPLRRPGPLTHFPRPTPQINTTTVPTSVQPVLVIRENWN